MAQLLHARAVTDGSFGCLNVANYLLNLYVKSHKFSYARKVFDKMFERDVRSWTILISGFARTGYFRMVMELFRVMQVEGVRPNEFTLSNVLRSCSGASELLPGKGVHGWIVTNGIELDETLENALLDFYAKCGELRYAERLFEAGTKRDPVALNIMIDGHMRAGDLDKSVALFNGLRLRDVYSWNGIINGMIRNGHIEAALQLLREMVKSGQSLNEITFSAGLVLASSLSLLELGSQIHCQVLVLGVHNEGFVRTCLIDFYAKCRKMDKALLIFEKTAMAYSKCLTSKAMTETITWSSVISGYVRSEDYERALQAFIYLIREQISVNRFMLTTIFSVCSKAGTLPIGRQIHAFTHKTGHKPDSPLDSSLVEMYSKCGSLEDAWKIFKQTSSPNVVLWSSIILACALHGQGLEAVKLFERMIRDGIKPNEVSFIVVLTACSHSGLLEQGLEYFRLMKEIYCINPETEHLACMVDLYGRAGRLDEAKEFIEKHNISHLNPVMKSFLSSCRVYNSLEMAKWAAQNLESPDEGSHVLFANTFAARHRWEESARVRISMQHKGIYKLPAQSWIELKSQVHSFVSGDTSHNRSSEIYSYLDKLIRKLKEIGYSSVVAGLVMQDVDEEEGEMCLGYHSEKLAVAFGIMSLPPWIPIRVMKNIRVCADCHSFIKLTSQLLGREIVLRDVRRFHHFKNGSCSCGDYW